MAVTAYACLTLTPVGGFLKSYRHLLGDKDWRGIKYAIDIM